MASSLRLVCSQMDSCSFKDFDFFAFLKTQKCGLAVQNGRVITGNFEISDAKVRQSIAIGMQNKTETIIHSAI